MSAPFLSLVGSTIVAMFFHVFVLYNVFVLIFKIDDRTLPRLGLPVFAGYIVGIFAAALYKPAEPFIAAIVMTALMLRGFQLSPPKRVVVGLLNLLLVFIPPFIRFTAGL